ncbi:tetraacyldisaccharide 4'-kinase [Aquimarina sp. AD10]|uniref:tetraacyldisaccharide 4'-kinase n=1 Tax=Aquimarina sp. AD10 TaxID=1714849 RepID=UPI000E505EDA|nr:tetraacyldisaccharide 4'-kinase [Aquimarina sp. AD10]AXT63131.1 tetraacyldisaccharide 4'-kinase [Aquimarina sp. AD10]RKM98653.1 tetraacyldisaccharide 4'-kinase [Aquimarina sp. AD10]
MNLLRKILFPIVPIYYAVTWLRNVLYDFGIKTSKKYDFPIIAVGNLSVGGTGKSPMVEYLIGLLKNEINVGTLSRGYKRETKGFQLVQSSSTAREVGDEPLQFKTKFKNVTVGVDGNRQRGIANLRSLNPKPETIILDDAYQHRKVKAGLYILLTAYYNLYTSDILLPTGDLREPRKGARRADIIVVTKCPIGISDKEKQDIARKLNIKDEQSLFFSSISYGKDLMCSSDSRSIDLFKESSFALVTGIATPKPLLDYYHSLGLKFDHINFPDHHNFSDKELIELEKNKCIVTTEKDYTRLASELSMKNIWYQPIEMEFLADKEAFEDLILKYVKEDM